MDSIYINCRYRDEIVVPLVCISPNWDFMCLTDKDKIGLPALMKDGVVAKITFFEMKTIFEFETLIKELYKVDAYEWLKKWYNACKGQLSNLYICHIHLTKEN